MHIARRSEHGRRAVARTIDVRRRPARLAFAAVAAVAPTAPGYRYLRRTVLPKLRESRRVNQMAERVFDLDAEQAIPLDFTGAPLVGGVGQARRPVVVVIMLGIEADDVRPAVDKIARLQLLTAGFRPVFGCWQALGPQSSPPRPLAMAHTSGRGTVRGCKTRPCAWMPTGAGTSCVGR
jgi:hypothetical protein